MARGEPTIANYDDKNAEEVVQRLRTLSQADLAKLEAYERQGQARSTVLEAIASLRGAEPWSGYDDMEVDEISAALRDRDGDVADRVLDYERRHKRRATVIEQAERVTKSARPAARTRSSTKSAPRSGGRKNGAAARGSSRKAQASRGQASRSSAKSAPRSSGRKNGASAGGSRRAAAGSSGKGQASRSSGRSASRPSAKRSSSERGRSSAQSARRSGPSSRGASKSRTRSRGGQSAPARVRQTAAGAVQSARGGAEKVVKGTGRAVGGAATQSRKVVGTAASKAKGPAMVTGAAAAAVGGALVLGSKALPGHTALGKRLPGRRSRLSQARRTVKKARKQILDAGDRVGAVGQQLSDANDVLHRIASDAGDRATP